MLQSETLQLPISYRYDLSVPDATPAPLLVALHGYGQDKGVALRFAQTICRASSRDWTLAALQAPHPHHIYKEKGRKGGGLGAGFSWVSSYEPGEDVRNHHLFLSHVIERAYAEGWSDHPSAFLFGFSQSVSLNYRFAATHPEKVRGVVAVAGATPSDWGEAGKEAELNAPVLHIAPTEDDAYPLERARHFKERLGQSREVTWLEVPGKHRVPSAAYPPIAQWLEERLARAQGVRRSGA